MTTVLTDEQVADFGKRLAARQADVLEEIRRELRQSDNEHYADLAERVHDVAEESVADLLSDVELAVIDLHVREHRDIEAARRRIAMGRFGVCLECGGAIEVKRLDACPTAGRCLACQQRYDETHATELHPRI